MNKLCSRYRSQNGEENSAVDNVLAIKYGIDMEPYIFEQVRDYFKQVETKWLQSVDCLYTLNVTF